MSAAEAAAAYGPLTQRVYLGLPEVYRTGDETATGVAHPLLRYLSAATESGDDIEHLVDRIIDGELLDATRAPAEWLPWLAQLVGARLPSAVSEATARDLVEHAAIGWRAGTEQALIAAARQVLGPTAYVTLAQQQTPTGAASPFDLTMRIRQSQAPDLSEVLRRIIDAGAKPAGIRLHVQGFSSTWAQIEDALPTWSAWEANTWLQIEEIGITVAVDPVLAITGLVTSTDGRTIYLSWSRPDASVDYVSLRRIQGTTPPGSSGGEEVGRFERTVTAFADAGLLADTTYSYSLISISTTGESSAPVNATQTTSPDIWGGTNDVWGGTDGPWGVEPGAAATSGTYRQTYPQTY